MKIRNVLHRGLRRFIENDDRSGLPSAVIPKLRNIVSFLQDMADPGDRELFLNAVLRQARAQGGEVDRVQRLVLVEAGEHHGFDARHRVFVRLQALGADFPIGRASCRERV